MTRAFGRFLARRLLAAALLVTVVSVSALVLVRLAPGDATTELLMTHADAGTIARTRARLGLDRPLGEQIAAWVAGVARLDLGTSSLYNRPVAPLVAERAANTARLAGLALLLATGVGLPVGVLTGARPHGWLSRVVTPLSTALVSMPPLVSALALLLLASTTGWLSTAPGHVLLPCLALALPLAAVLERLQSNAMAEALVAPDLIAAAARGIPPARLLWVHAARQSMRPVLGVYGVIIGSLFSGSLAVEIVAAWPGLGRLMYDGLVSRDLFLVAGCSLFGALVLAAGNLAADVVRAWADPRVQVES